MNKVTFRHLAALIVSLAILLGFTATGHAQYTNGIYAEFNTSMGSYTCRLEYALAPKACANFIGLATGQRAWLQATNGQVKTNAYYNGTTFHRVIGNFMNQGGSPNGLGTDGPGYAFVDEFHPSLRHDTYGTLSCANSGPDSNGAQFFVTATNSTSWLDNVHTVFGKLYGGSNVVYAINHVATGANDKPLTNVVLQSISIKRIGTNAQAFSINAQGLPLVTNLTAKIARASTNISVTFSNRLYADNRFYSSTNLTNWAGVELGIHISGTASNAVTRTASTPKEFFRMAQIQYPTSTFAPINVFNRTLTLNFNAGVGTIIISFNSSGGGTYTYNGSPGTVTSYTWIQEPYNGKLWPIYYSNLVPMTLNLNFDSASAGTFSGTAYASPPFSVSGAFTLP